MEKRVWRVKRWAERPGLIEALEVDGFVASPEDRYVGKFVIVEANPTDWDIVEALVATNAPSATEAQLGH